MQILSRSTRMLRVHPNESEEPFSIDKDIAIIFKAIHKYIRPG